MDPRLRLSDKEQMSAYALVFRQLSGLQMLPDGMKQDFIESVGGLRGYCNLVLWCGKIHDRLQGEGVLNCPCGISQYKVAREFVDGIRSQLEPEENDGTLTLEQNDQFMKLFKYHPGVE